MTKRQRNRRSSVYAAQLGILETQRDFMRTLAEHLYNFADGLDQDVSDLRKHNQEMWALLEPFVEKTPRHKKVKP